MFWREIEWSARGTITGLPSDNALRRGSLELGGPVCPSEGG